MKKSKPWRHNGLHCRWVVTLFLIFASTAALKAQITVAAKDPTLGQIISVVKAQSSYQFFYDSRLATRKVNSVDVKNVSVETLLKTALDGTEIAYKADGNIYYLSDAHVSKSSLTVSGRVTDAKGNPIGGVSVTIEGSTVGAVTSDRGTYQLAGVPEGNSRLIFSFVGYEKQTITVGRQSVIDVSMNEEQVEIDKVVVTALGIKRSTKSLSYNAKEIGGGELTSVKDANMVNSLTGKVAGMTINSGSSGIGSAAKVVVRGTKSIMNSSNVLYVIDGVPMFDMLGDKGEMEFGSRGSSEAVADLNPEDVESMTVLMGAAASALYGSLAANGAILITTKKGMAGQTTVSVASGTDLLSVSTLPRFQNRYGTGDPTVTGGSTIKSWGSKLNEAGFMGYDPRSDYFRTGVVFNNSVSLATGTEKNQTYISAASVNSNGVVPNNQYDRYNFSFRNTSSFLKNDRMKLDLGASYIIQKDLNMTNQGVYYNPLTSAYLFPRGDDFDMVRVFERYNASRKISEQYWPQGEGDFRMQNPYWINYRNLRANDKKRYMLNAGLTWQPLDWLSLAGRARIDNSSNDYTEKIFSSTVLTLAGGANGKFRFDRSLDRQTYADAIVSVNKTFADKYSLSANIGTSITDLLYDSDDFNGPLNEQGIPNLFQKTNVDKSKRYDTQSGWRQQSQAIFASVEAGYDNMLFLTLTGRNEWASPLADSPQEKSGFFYPSVGLSAIVSEMVRMPQAIPYVKVRGSYASVGTPPQRGLSILSYVYNSERDLYSPFSHYPIGDLFAERTDSWEAGLTTRFLNHFNLDMTFYHAITSHQTFEPGISVSSGYSTLYVQTGSVRNRGFEAMLSYSNKWAGDWRWSSSFNLGVNRNKIQTLVRDYVHPETGELINKDRLDIGGLARARFILKEGGSMGDLYSITDFKRDAAGNIYVDADGQVSTQTSGDIYLGSVMPKANLGWSNSVSWKNLSLTATLSARLGGVGYSATQAALDLYGVSEASALARDRGGVIINGGDMINAQTWYTAIGSQSGMPQYYTYSATNVRLQELSIGYTIPRRWLAGIMDITASIVGRNLLMIYNKAPFDPESVASTNTFYQGIDYFMMPATRNIGFNIRIKY
ncbi:MAG: SusC/RagA family TonB-linked outer membrane protein [Rikenellaceae bacterium]|jgi:TonB-linked SusC/RagA family outer membrane protein|nr:SusC/RagA family TonB-linked outer membrane protein [Rikenellaceae bacterium]